LETARFLKYFKGQKNFKKVIEKITAPPGEKIHTQNLETGAIYRGEIKKIENSNKNIIVFLNDREEAAYFTMI